MRVDGAELFILHSRPFRETSLLVDILSRDYGRLRAVYRGGRQQKLQPFTPVSGGWSGKGELKTLRAMEAAGPAFFLSGVKLYAALYVNELLTRLLHEQDPHPALFDGYNSLLQAMTAPQSADIPLRRFERLVLEELGYGYQYSGDAVTGEPFKEEQWYWFDPEQGFLASSRTNENAGKPNWVKGANLKCIESGDMHNGEALATARQIHQLAFSRLLGGGMLNSHGFFRQSRSV